MRKTLREIASYLNGEVVGDDSVIISGVRGIKEAQAGDITFVANPKYAPLIEKTNASAIITSKEIVSSVKTIVRTDNPSLAFAKIVSLAAPHTVNHPQGIHPSAIIGKGTQLGKGVALGAYVVIGENASIGDGSIIYSGSFIGDYTSVGSNALIYPNVSIREGISVGKNVIIHSGTVIGSDGFGFEMVEGQNLKIPQIGTVVIEDDVEIGANVTIDRARFDKTVIGRGTKIDNLVQIAHNVVVGENSIIVAQAGVSGSTVLGKKVILAGQVGLVGHISLGDGVVVAAQSGVSKSIPANTVVWGYPAQQIDQAKKVNACVQRLPHLTKAVQELRKRIEELESRSKE